MKLRLATVAAVAALTLTACGGTTPTGGATDADAAATTAPSAAPSDPSEAPEPTEEPTEEPTPEEAGPANFGQTFTYEDGLAVTVTVPAKFKPSEYAMSGEAKGTPLKFQVTVKNGTTKVFDPTMTTASVQSNEAEAEEIFDSESGLNGSPSTKVLPGKSVKFFVGFNVLNAKDITMEFAPSFEHESQLFTNTA